MTTQPPLFPAPPRKPKPPTRFELESRRRGAPFMVAGKRWRMEKARKVDSAAQAALEAPQRRTGDAKRGLRRIGEVMGR